LSCDEAAFLVFLFFILVVGDKEKAAGAVAVRARGNTDLGVMSLDAFSQRIASDIALKT